MKPSRAIARQTVAHEQTAQTIQSLQVALDSLHEQVAVLTQQLTEEREAAAARHAELLRQLAMKAR